MSGVVESADAPRPVPTMITSRAVPITASRAQLADDNTLPPSPSAWQRTSALAGDRKLATLAAVVLAVIAVMAVLAPWITPYPPNKLSIVNRLLAPSALHWFGTDEFGRDVFTRTVFAARVSLLVGLSVVAISVAVGVVLGIVAGFSRRLDAFISRLMDAMMAFPDILLAIALVAALGPSLGTVIVALSIVYTPRLSRVVRASTLVIRELPYIEAARALGVTDFRIAVRHVLRNLVSPLLVQGSFIFAYAILAEAGLSFLGVGVDPDVPTWGTMIAAGRQYVGRAEWLMFCPGLAIVLSALSLQILGDSLRDLLDPTVQKSL
ncbi:MAG: peptide transporter permease [Rhizobacter sp.]|nr:peptide transporter permease [Rhizobacter sp.]